MTDNTITKIKQRTIHGFGANGETFGVVGFEKYPTHEVGSKVDQLIDSVNFLLKEVERLNKHLGIIEGEERDK